jgi:hypothetical protein
MQPLLIVTASLPKRCVEWEMYRTGSSHSRACIGKPGGGPTQCRGDQRSGGGGDGAVFSLIGFCVRGDQRSGGGGGGDGAAARTKMARKRYRRLLQFRGRIGTGAGGGESALNLNPPHQLTHPPLPGDRGEKNVHGERGGRGRWLK